MSAPRKPNVIRLGAYGGTQRYYAVQTRAGDGLPSRLRLTPQQAFGQLTTIGDTAQVSDQRTASLIFGTGGGLGRDKYQETEGLTQYRWGDWDTRFEEAAALPLAATQLGSATALTTGPVYVEYLGLAGATLLAWVPRQTIATNAAYYSGSAWATIVPGVGSLSYLTGFARYRGAYYLAVGDPAHLGALYSSTNGTSWTMVAASISDSFWGICVHDNKFYGFSRVTNQMRHTLDATTDPTGSSWTASNETLDLHPGEEVMQLLEWEDDQRRKAVYLLTTQRLLRYDDEALTFTQVDDFSGEIWGASSTGGASASFLPRMTVWKADNNLYVNFFDRTATATAQNNLDTILQYTRQQKGFIAPNKLSGLPAANQVAITHTIGGLNYLFAFGAAPSGTTNTGQVYAWDGQGWHPLYTPTSSGLAVIGGGYARGTLYTARADKTVVSQPYGDNRIPPQFRTDTYETGVTRQLWLARTTGGTDLLPKRELWLTVPARKHDGSFGLDTGCTLTAYRRVNGGAWLNLGTATSAQAFPWVVDIGPTKASWIEMEVRIDAASSSSANTPILGNPQLHYDRTPQDVRDTHDFIIDLDDSAGVPQDDPLRGEHGRSKAAIVTELLALRGQLVRLEYGEGPWGSTTAGKVLVATGLFQAALEADPLRGPVLLRCEVRDVSTPTQAQVVGF